MDNTNMEIAQKLKVSGKTPSFILLRTQTQKKKIFLGGGGKSQPGATIVITVWQVLQVVLCTHKHHIFCPTILLLL